ncbi:MAG TPA: maleylpyruvate isomerase family mycothiol-dependent enzyme [Acidimicrobiales bacterium]|nr:maleylpyruvate isomerase family mycothiol-dependent enzyme [Acidimicrobiales bacterium]
MSERLRELRNSVERLANVVSGLDTADYTTRAYPSEWTIADTLSHLGSGAVIGQRRFEDVVAGREGDPHFNASVWDEWNAKEPSRQVAECLVSDASLLGCLEGATEAQRDAFHFSMGPLSIDFEAMVGLRLSEHVLHTWDVEVAQRPGATLDNEAANAILEAVRTIIGYAAKYAGPQREISIQTFDPVRHFTLHLNADGVDLVETASTGSADLAMPAESLVRLIYGRLDERSTPATVSGDAVNELRAVFPGF